MVFLLCKWHENCTVLKESVAAYVKQLACVKFSVSGGWSCLLLWDLQLRNCDSSPLWHCLLDFDYTARSWLSCRPTEYSLFLWFAGFYGYAKVVFILRLSFVFCFIPGQSHPLPFLWTVLPEHRDASISDFSSKYQPPSPNQAVNH